MIRLFATPVLKTGFVERCIRSARRLPLLLGLLVLAAASAGCADELKKAESAWKDADSDAPPTVADLQPPAAEVVDGVQVATIRIERFTYEPRRLRLEAGVPARLVFDQQSTIKCARQVQIPDFSVDPVELPFGEKTAVEFVPDQTGVFQFVCGMNMMSGTLLVEESPASGAST